MSASIDCVEQRGRLTRIAYEKYVKNNFEQRIKKKADLVGFFLASTTAEAVENS